MWDFWLKSLRGRMILVAVIMVCVPILVAGYSMKNSAEQALLAEKRGKLLAVGVMMDNLLGPGGFDAILVRAGVQNASREEKIKALNRALAPLSDDIAAASPGLGAGYYCRDLDAIITYAPQAEFGHTVGLAIDATHPGRQVMETGEQRVEFGSLVRGDIMNAMHPLARDGKVIGYVFANELNDDINAQLSAMDQGLLTSMTVGLILAVALILALIHSMLRDINVIIRGLKDLRFDLNKPIKGLKGELGEVAATVNEMAVALADARSLSEDIMESMTDGVVAVDNHGVVTALNRSASGMTGLTARNVIGLGHGQVFEDLPQLCAMLEDTLHSGQNHANLEFEFVNSHGERWLSVSTWVLKNQGGHIIGAAAVFRDLTETKRLEQQVNQADRLATLGELMAGVAHEIRNPLTSIKGFLQYFQVAGTAEERARYLPMMLGEVDRMNRIIESLLFFSRPSQTQANEVDLRRLLRETFILVQSRARNQDVEIDIDVSEDLPLVILDSAQFKQVFLNLALNALQAMGRGGRLTAGARPLEDGQTLEITFADTGPGIAPKVRDKVFDPFFTTKKAGTGLGLSVVRRIVEARGGAIEAQDNPGGGARIRIALPLRPDQGETTDVSGQDTHS